MNHQIIFVQQTLPYFSTVFAGAYILRIFLIFFLIITVIAIICWLIDELFTHPHSENYHNEGTYDHALSLLKQRYAKGEIDREEFEERRMVLTNRSK